MIRTLLFLFALMLVGCNGTQGTSIPPVPPCAYAPGGIPANPCPYSSQPIAGVTPAPSPS